MPGQQAAQDDQYANPSLLSPAQATALVVGREVRLVGTANIGQPGPGYTTLESVPGADKMDPLTVGYYQVDARVQLYQFVIHLSTQDRHYQSLATEAKADSLKVSGLWSTTSTDSGLGGEQLLQEREAGQDMEMEELEKKFHFPPGLRVSRATSPQQHTRFPRRPEEEERMARRSSAAGASGSRNLLKNLSN